MSEINQVSVGFSGDLTELDSAYAEAIALAENFGNEVSNMASPSIKANFEVGGSGGMGGMGQDIGASLMAAMAPLTGIADKIRQQFDVIGGTVVTLARRIDASMKLDLAKKRIEAFGMAFKAVGVSAMIAARIISPAYTVATLIPQVAWIEKKLVGAFTNAATKIFKIGSSISTFWNRIGDVAGKSLTKLGLTAPGIKGIGVAANFAGKGLQALKLQAASALGIMSGFGFAGGLIAFLTKGVSGASDLGESVDKVSVLYGSAGSAIIAESDKMASSFGVNKQQWIDSASAIGNMTKLTGASVEQAVAYGNKMVHVGSDLGSLLNIPVDEVMAKITSGLSGQSEGLRDLNIFINETSVANEALRLGFGKNGAALTEGQKIQARYNLIVKQGAYATGNLAQTFGSTKNQVRAFGSRLMNMATQVGAFFLPMVDKLLAGLNWIVKGIGDFVTRNTELFTSWGSWIANFFGDLATGVTEEIGVFIEIFTEIGTALGITSSMFDGAGGMITKVLEGISFGARNLGGIMRLVWLYAKQGVFQFLDYLSVIPANLGIIGTYLAGNWVKIITDGVTAVLKVFLNLGKNIWDLGVAIVNFIRNPSKGFTFNFTPLLDGFKATAEQLPTLIKPQLTSLQTEIDKASEMIGAKELKRAEDMRRKIVQKVAIPKAPPMPDLEDPAAKKTAKAGTHHEKTSAGAFDMSSKEAYSTIINAKNTASKTDGFRQVGQAIQAGNAIGMDQRALLRKIANNTADGPDVDF